MPTLPDPSQLGRVGIRGGEVVTAQGGLAEASRARAAAADVEGAFQMGRNIAQLSGQVLDFAAREKQKLDRLKADEGATRLRDASTELLVGDGGALTVQEGGVLQKDYLKRYVDAYDAKAKEIGGSLANPDQRIAFERERDQLRSSYMRSILTHSLAESDKYAETTFQGQRASFVNYAQAQYNNPDAIKAGVEGVRAAVLNRAAQKGITDQATLDQMMLEETGNVHAGVVEAARKAGAVNYAKDYFAAVRDSLTAAQAQDLETRLKPAIAFDTGNTVASQAFEMKQAGESAVNIQKFINDNTDTPEARGAAQSIMQELEQAYKKDIDEQVGGLILGFYDGGMDYASRNSTIQSDEFLALDDATKSKIYEHMTNIAEGTENRAERDKETSLDNFVRLGQFVEDPEILARMSDGEIIALAPELGKTNAMKLKAMRDKVRAEGAGTRLDTKLIDAAVQDVPKEYVKDVKATIAAKFMDWKLDHPGRVPSPEEQQQIVQSGQEPWIKANSWFFKEKPAYKIKAGEGYPVFWEQEYPDLPGKKKLEKYNEFVLFSNTIKSNIRQRNKPAPTDDQILAAWRLREQKQKQKPASQDEFLKSLAEQLPR
jgi:hypothetical protein